MLRQIKKRDESNALVPIFGCRKRQRTSVLADPIDLPSASEDDKFLLNALSLETHSNQTKSQYERERYSKQQKQSPSSVLQTYNLKHISNRNIVDNQFQSSHHQHQHQNRFYSNFNNVNIKQQSYNQINDNSRLSQKQLLKYNNTNEIKKNIQQQDQYPKTLIQQNQSQLSTLRKNLVPPSTSNYGKSFLSPWEEGSNKENYLQSNSFLSSFIPQEHVLHNGLKESHIKGTHVTVCKFVTTLIKNLKDWLKVTERKPIIFEIFGTMESTISHGKPEKSFHIKDQTGMLRCVLWEIDRPMPHLPRGSIVRCVGKFNEDYFHCFSIRQVKVQETNLFELILEKSDQELHNQMFKSREV